MAYRESLDDVLFEAELGLGPLSSPLAWIPQLHYWLPIVLIVFAYAPGILLAGLLHTSPLFTAAPLGVLVFVLFAVGANAYVSRLRPRVKVHGDRVVFWTTRRTLTLPRSSLTTTVEHRRSPRYGYSCLVLTGGAVELSVGTPKLLAVASAKTGLPHLACDEATLRGLATALGVELAPPVPPEPELTAKGKRRWRS